MTTASESDEMASVHELRADAGSRATPPVTNWVPTAIAVATVICSTIGSVLVAGVYLGQFKEALRTVQQAESADHDTWDRATQRMSDAIGGVNANLAGLTAEMHDFATALERERQDRLNYEAEQARRGR